MKDYEQLPIRSAGFVSPADVVWVRVTSRARCGSVIDGVTVYFDGEQAGGVWDANDILRVADAIREARK